MPRGVLIVLHYFEMLLNLLGYFPFVFPHTSARFAHWYLLTHHNTELLDLHTLIVSILPTCIYIINLFASRHVNFIDDDEELLGNHAGPLRTINDCIQFWFFVYKAFDIMAALDLVFSASGFCRRVLLMVDLIVEGTVVLVAKAIFFLAVSLFVGAAFQGFPFVKKFCIGVLLFLRLLVLDLRDFLDEIFERDGIHAEEPDEEGEDEDDDEEEDEEE